jgi:hypothetical protein
MKLLAASVFALGISLAAMTASQPCRPRRSIRLRLHPATSFAWPAAADPAGSVVPMALVDRATTARAAGILVRMAGTASGIGD